MTFARLTRGDAVAMVAALALLLVMSLTWYSTTDADAARQIEDLAQPKGGDSPDLQRIREDASFVADRADRNAWQVSGTIDRVILTGLLATILLAVTAAWLRAGDRRFDPPLTPSAAAALAAGVTAVLIAYRMVQEPGQDAIATVEPAALVALGLLAVITFACRAALVEEVAGSAWATVAPEGQPDAEAGGSMVSGEATPTAPLPAAVLEPATVPRPPPRARQPRPPSPRPTDPPAAPPPVDLSPATDETTAKDETTATEETPKDEGDATRISLATATVDELRTLNGIGPALARRIVEHRERIGGFDSVEELGGIDGIGAKRLTDLKDALEP